jgi:hypothetical protein
MDSRMSSKSLPYSSWRPSRSSRSMISAKRQPSGSAKRVSIQANRGEERWIFSFR